MTLRVSEYVFYHLKKCPNKLFQTRSLWTLWESFSCHPCETHHHVESFGFSVKCSKMAFLKLTPAGFLAFLSDHKKARVNSFGPKKTGVNSPTSPSPGRKHLEWSQVALHARRKAMLSANPFLKHLRSKTRKRTKVFWKV